MWSRKQAIASVPPIVTWPTAISASLDPSQQEQFDMRVEAVKQYFDNVPLARIQETTGIHRVRVVQLAKKCVLTASDGDILGFRALLPYIRTKRYERRAEEKPKFPEGQGGQSGALRKLLDDYPEVEEVLLRHIRQDAKAQSVAIFKLRPKDLHRLFIRVLNERGVSRTRWPFTTKYYGKRSIERYMHDFLSRNFSHTVQTRGSKVARAHLPVGTGNDAFLRFDEPYAAVEIDAYNVDGHMVVAMETPEGTVTYLALERLWILAVVDRSSTAFLAWDIVFRSEVTADDVLKVIRMAISERWTPLLLTLDALEYPKDGGFPSASVPGAYGAVWTSMHLDGALAHLAKAVHDRARKVLGCVICWGAPGHFEKRPNVEMSFKRISADIFLRLPSTTGSSPTEGRADNAEKKAIKYRIQATHIKELVDVYLAQHNSTPGEGGSYLSPLEVMRQFFEDGNARFVPRRLPGHALEGGTLFPVREIGTVRGNLKTGRRPYVQVDRVHYTNPVLSNAGQLIGTKLILVIDEEDMRHITVFLPNGAALGVLKAQGKWGVTKHSRRTRRAINSLASRRVIVLTGFDDPILVYEQHLANNKEGKGGKQLSRRQVTELTRTANEAGHAPRLPHPTPVTLPPPSVPEPQSSSSTGRRTLMDKELSFFTSVKNRR